MLFISISTRDSFKPPAVEPAQAPINISITIIDLENCGQRLKSAVANPVVDIMEVTWKNEDLTVSGRFPNIWYVLIAIAVVDTPHIMR